MRQLGIKGRVMFVALIPSAVIAAVLAIYSIQIRMLDMDISLRDRGLAIVRQLAPASEYGVFSGNREILKNLTDAALQESDVTGVVITDANGNILANSGQSAGLLGVIDFQAGSNIATRETDSSLTFSAPVHASQIEVSDFDQTQPESSSQPAKRHLGRIIGRVSIEMSKLTTERRQFQSFINSLLITMLGLVGAGLLAYRMSRGVIRPVLRLADVVERIRKGDLSTHVEENSQGELLVLEKGVNTMAAALRASHDSLQERIAEATERLSYQASHDTLTGLVNRHEFEARVERALASARESGHEHTLCYLDLDQFKVVNDTCGHVAGDELLSQLAVILQAKVRDRDTLARLGGDEFGVLFENCSIDQAQKLAEILRQTIRDFHFVWHDKPFVIGASIGLVPITKDSDNLSRLLSAADAACYAAKDKGRNRIHVYQLSDSDRERRHGEMQWVLRLNRALEENRFRLYCQHIVPLDPTSGNEIHYEILLRMLDDHGQLVLPMAFIPAAERYNLMPTIDRWVLSAAFSVYHNIFPADRDGDHTLYTINLSGASLCDENFQVFIQRQFQINNVPYDAVCFEITETAAITNLGQAIEFMESLKSLGCRFSLDDFGSGLSSFTYLKNLPVDFLKIDGTFVRNMVNDAMDRAMVESINHIGHVMGLKTIAEYVESEQINQMLKEIGVDYAQGDWVEEPHPLSILEKLPQKGD